MEETEKQTAEPKAPDRASEDGQQISCTGVSLEESAVVEPKGTEDTVATAKTVDEATRMEVTDSVAAVVVEHGGGAGESVPEAIITVEIEQSGEKSKGSEASEEVVQDKVVVEEGTDGGNSATLPVIDKAPEAENTADALTERETAQHTSGSANDAEIAKESAAVLEATISTAILMGEASDTTASTETGDKEEEVTVVPATPPTAEELAPRTVSELRPNSPDITQKSPKTKKTKTTKKAKKNKAPPTPPLPPTPPAPPTPPPPPSPVIEEYPESEGELVIVEDPPSGETQKSQPEDVQFDEERTEQAKPLTMAEKRRTAKQENDVYGDFQCEYRKCKKRTYLTFTSLQAHYTAAHTKSENCAACGASYLNVNSLRTHLPRCSKMLNQDVKKVDCFAKDPKCDKKFYRWTEMRDHLEKYHKQFFDENKEEYMELYKSHPKAPKKDEILPAPKKEEVLKGKYGKVRTKEEHFAMLHEMDPEVKVPLPAATSKKQPICHLEPTKSTKEEKLAMFQVLMPDDKLEIIQEKDKSKFNYPGHVRIEIAQGGILRHFPAFIAYMVQSKLVDYGGIVIKPPPSFRPHKDNFDLMEKLSKINVSCGEVVTAEQNPVEPLAFELDSNPYEYAPEVSLLHLYRSKKEGADWKLSLEERENRLFDKLAFGEECEPYIQNLSGSLFDANVDFWNLRKLDNDLTNPNVFGMKEGEKRGNRLINVDGINRPQLYIGRRNTVIPLHKEDYNLGSVLYNHLGAEKVLYVVDPKCAPMIEQKMAEITQERARVCPAFLRHKMAFINPKLLDEWKISYSKLVIREGEFAVLASNAYHTGFNLGFNIVESVNFLTFECVDNFLDDSYTCCCRNNPLILARDGVVEKYMRDGLEAYNAGELQWNRPNDPNNTFTVLNQQVFMKHYVEIHNGILDFTLKNPGEGMIVFQGNDPRKISMQDLMLLAEAWQSNTRVVLRKHTKEVIAKATSKKRGTGERKTATEASSRKRKIPGPLSKTQPSKKLRRSSNDEEATTAEADKLVRPRESSPESAEQSQSKPRRLGSIILKPTSSRSSIRGSVTREKGEEHQEEQGQKQNEGILGTQKGQKKKKPLEEDSSEGDDVDAVEEGEKEGEAVKGDSGKKKETEVYGSGRGKKKAPAKKAKGKKK